PACALSSSYTATTELYTLSLHDALPISDEKLFARLADGRTYSYGDVERVSARFANLVRNLGAKPGDRVAVQVEKSIEALMLYLRSEEHTSELQSRENLVCRLLLEKKKKK